MQSNSVNARSEINEAKIESPVFSYFPIMERNFPDRMELYSQIRIPTAKSDIALLLLLYEFGGLYIDCHCGIRDADQIRRLLACLVD